MKVFPILTLSTIALAGCSNPKEANKSNFEHAINEWIEKGPPCLDVPDRTVTAPGQKYNALPAYVEATPRRNPSRKSPDRGGLRHLRPLSMRVS